MSERLKIDNTIKEKSTDFYYSATDVYGIDIFTEDFRKDEELVISANSEKASEVMNALFYDRVVQNEQYADFASEMFLGRQYETKYRDYKEESGAIVLIACCLLSAILSLGMCVLLTGLIKRNHRKKQI